jgi:hypothetical protein
MTHVGTVRKAFEEALRAEGIKQPEILTERLIDLVAEMRLELRKNLTERVNYDRRDSKRNI